MPSLHSIFIRWLTASQHRFTHPPRDMRQHRRGYSFHFTGITTAIWGSIAWSGSAIGVDYRGTCWDFLADFDLVDLRLPDGAHVCQLCEPPHRVEYPTRKLLLVNHCLEPLLVWCNSRFTETSWLWLSGTENDSTWARIAPADWAKPGAAKCIVAAGPLSADPVPVPTESAE